jgi:hypothetical protein
MHTSEERRQSAQLAGSPGPLADALPAPRNDARRAGGWELWLLGLVFFLVPPGYVLYTGNVWEDYFITFRFSRNLAQGKGLVFQPGERVQGFTSPINTLLPAVFDWMNGSRDYEFALWAYRLVSAAAFGAAGLFLTNLVRRESGPGDAAPVVFPLLLILDFKAVAFSANGQESAFMLLFLALGFGCLYGGPAENWRLLGVSWAGLLLTRPDGCVYIVILSFVSLVNGTVPARKQLAALAKAAALAAVLYLPWIITATVYYGSPVPHTVIAKSVGQPDSPVGVELVKRVLKGVVDVAPLTSAPIYANVGGWPWWVAAFCLALGLCCACYWLIPSSDRLGRMASLAYLLGCLYLSFYSARSYNGAPFPWYLPPVNLFGLIVLARAPGTLLAKFGPAESVRMYGGLIQAGIVAGMAGIFLMGCQEMRIQQRAIEQSVRVPLGQWLAENVAPSETVYSEALGYFGFFGECHMLDWPGLVSPRVVRARRNGHNNFFMVIPALRPDWLVLRPHEVEAIRQTQPYWKDYAPVKAFTASPPLSAYGDVPGINYLKFDETYVILKRKNNSDPDLPTRAAP